jgi:hypothetical protein
MHVSPAGGVLTWWHGHRRAEANPLAPIKHAIAKDGARTRFAETDQLQREADGRECYPPLPPE